MANFKSLRNCDHRFRAIATIDTIETNDAVPQLYSVQLSGTANNTEKS